MIYPPQTLSIIGQRQTDDGIGGVTTTEDILLLVKGYIDAVGTGTDAPSQYTKGFIEQSTHVAIIKPIPKALVITDKMRLADANGRHYDITFVDDPVGINHHLEVYLKYTGEANDGQSGEN